MKDMGKIDPNGNKQKTLFVIYFAMFCICKQLSASTFLLSLEVSAHCQYKIVKEYIGVPYVLSNL